MRQVSFERLGRYHVCCRPDMSDPSITPEAETDDESVTAPQERSSQKGLDEISTNRIIDGKYQITKPLRRGGMGVVCEATHLGTGRRVAVKLLSIRETAPVAGLPEDNSSLQRKAGMVRRFHREARAAGAVDSQHIVQIFDTGTDPDTAEPYMVMELLRGEDVRQVLKRVEVLAPDAAVRVAAQACQGLEKAHQASIIHRDIKPANLFLTESDDGQINVKILDFGIAKMKLPDGVQGDTPNLTQTGSIVGSPYYMSPEQIQGLKSIDHRTDVWSMGVLLYRALSGCTPHRGDSTGQLLVLICTSPAVPLREVAPWVSHDVASIVDRALAVDPADRISSAAELRRELLTTTGGDQLLTKDMLVSVPAEARIDIGPIPATANDENNALSTVITAVNDAKTPPPNTTRDGGGLARRRYGWVWVAAGVGATGVVAMLTFTAPSESTVASTPASNTPTPEPLMVPSTTGRIASALQEVVVAIDPPQAAVVVDGKTATVVDGKLKLRGAVGTTYQVSVSAHDREMTKAVAITFGGAVPARLSIDAVVPTTPPQPPRPGMGLPVPAPAPTPTSLTSRPTPKPLPSAQWGDNLKPSDSLE